MQVTETKAERLKREYAMTLPAAAMAAKMDAKIAEVRSGFQMKGFRKGKAPTALLKKMFAKNLMGEILQESVDEAMKTHFEASGDRPSQQPEVAIKNENFNEGDDLRIELKYERLPEIPEADLGAIELERLAVEVTKAEVDAAIGKLAEQAPEYETKAGAAKDGDQVTFDFKGEVGGEAFDGGAAEDFPLVLGSGQFIPGFEDQLIGVKSGDEKTVEVTFPDDYGAEKLAGKDAVFTCAIKDVAARKTPEMTDAFAQKFGADDMEALHKQIEERLSSEYQGAARQVVKRKLLDALDDIASFDLPEGLVASEAAEIAHQLWHEEKPDVEGHDHEKIEPTEEHVKLAERRVRLGLLLAEIGKKAEIEVTEAEINQAIFRQASQFPGREKMYFDHVRQNPETLQQIRGPLFEDKVVDYALELAKVTDKKAGKAELEKAVEALED